MPNIKFFTSSLLALLLCAPLHGESIPASTTDDIIFKEDDVIITSHDVDMLLQDMTQPQKERVLSDKGKLRNLLLDLVVQRKTTREARKKLIHNNDFIKWKINHSNSQLLSKFLIKDYRKNIVVPPSIELLAKEYYNTHPSNFTSAETVKISHILVSTALPKYEKKCDKDYESLTKNNKLEKAQKVLQELNNGLDFSKAAEKYSDDKNTANKGGQLNFITRGIMVKKFEDAAFNLKEDQELSPIIETRFGYHIIKRTDYKPKTIAPYSSVKDKLILQEKNKYLAKKTTQYTESFSEDPKKLAFSASNFNKVFDKNKKIYLNKVQSATNE